MAGLSFCYPETGGQLHLVVWLFQLDLRDGIAQPFRKCGGFPKPGFGEYQHELFAAPAGGRSVPGKLLPRSNRGTLLWINRARIRPEW